MAVFELKSPLTAEERQHKRKVILQDVVALLSLFAITAALAVATYFLFNSFSRRRQALAERWLERGEAAISNGHPEQAVDAFRSALEYDPGERETEIKLAMALSAAGRSEEAISYFNTLLESEPGNGLINLELARLAAKQRNEPRAIEYYQRALDGRWQGDGYERRRMVRLELARYLIGQKDYAKARTQLLVAAGNAPDDPNIKLEIAGLMEEAQDPANALEIYQNIAEQKPCPIEALEGAGRVAFALGRFKQAHEFLERVVSHPDFVSLPESVQSSNRELLAATNHVLELFPATELPAEERAKRVLHAAEVAKARLESCSMSKPTPPSMLADLVTKWQQIPAKLSPPALDRDAQMEQTIMNLVFDTEKQTAAACGTPGGEDVLLLKIAQSPPGMEMQ
jgi:tetratricopeptide (TPR) repeat protein